MQLLVARIVVPFYLPRIPSRHFYLQLSLLAGSEGSSAQSSAEQRYTAQFPFSAVLSLKHGRSALRDEMLYGELIVCKRKAEISYKACG
jgi:hypothetical protein